MNMIAVSAAMLKLARSSLHRTSRRFFFFQAEDGIRDVAVTGVQTCALPISLILKYGTEAQKRFYLPRICRGEAFFCIGMSEPGAGSDLASVKTRAVPNGKGDRKSVV